MAKKENTGQPRREVLVKTGMALLALITKGTGPTDTFAESNAIDAFTKTQEKSNEGLNLIAPTPADFVSLGEQISYLSNLPSGARVHDVANAARRLLDILSDIDLPATREAVRPLYHLRCHYGLSSKELCEQSKRSIAEKLIPIRRALYAEVSDFDAS